MRGPVRGPVTCNDGFETSDVHVRSDRCPVARKRGAGEHNLRLASCYLALVEGHHAFTSESWDENVDAAFLFDEQPAFNLLDNENTVYGVHTPLSDPPKTVAKKRTPPRAYTDV